MTGRNQTRSLMWRKVLWFVCYGSSWTHVYPASSLAEVHRKLAEADKEDIRRGNTAHEVPGSVFIHNGLEIEDQE